MPSYNWVKRPESLYDRRHSLLRFVNLIEIPHAVTSRPSYRTRDPLFSNAFRLVAACCRWPHSAEREAAVCAAVEPITDWQRVLRIAARQRVEALVHDGLSRSEITPPPWVAAELSAAARRIASANLRLAAESARLGREMNAAEIPYVVAKGAPLAILAYGTLAFKMAADIDLIVTPTNIKDTETSLVQCGYRQFGAATEKHQSWVSRDGQTLVELHHRLVNNTLLLNGVSASSPHQTVEFGPGQYVRTLAPDTLYAYLCVHGASHAWSRLKWLADFTALISSQPHAAIRALHESAVAIGAGNASAQALLLSARVLGTSLGPGLEAELQKSVFVRGLLRAALQTMAGKNEVRELPASVLSSIPVHLSHLLLGNNFGYILAELRRKFGVSARRSSLWRALNRRDRPHAGSLRLR